MADAKKTEQAPKSGRRTLPFEEYKGYLSAAELKAVGTLESEGWQLFVDAKLEETGEKDGKRRRTFRTEGRYNLVLACKTVKP